MTVDRVLYTWPDLLATQKFLVLQTKRIKIFVYIHICCVLRFEQNFEWGGDQTLNFSREAVRTTVFHPIFSFSYLLIFWTQKRKDDTVVVISVPNFLSCFSRKRIVRTRCFKKFISTGSRGIAKCDSKDQLRFCWFLVSQLVFDYLRSLQRTKARISRCVKTKLLNCDFEKTFSLVQNPPQHVLKVST